MSKTSTWRRRLAALALAALTGSCAGDGDAVLDMFGAMSGSGDLASGDYLISDVDVQSDDCEVDIEAIEGQIFDVQIDGSDMLVNGFFTGEIHNGVFDFGDAAELDLASDGYDCVLSVSRQFDGVTTAENEADASYRLTASVVSGNECEDALLLDLPCSSKASFSMARLAASSLQDGFYAFPNPGLSPNDCGLGGSFYGQYTGGDVVVSTTELEIDLGDTVLVYDIDGIDLYDPSSPGLSTFDFSDPTVAADSGLSQTYDCVVSQDIQFVGSISTSVPNEFRIEDHYDLDGNGSQCSGVEAEFGLSFPCTSIDGTDAVLE